MKKSEKANCHLESMMVALPRKLVPEQMRCEKTVASEAEG